MLVCQASYPPSCSAGTRGIQGAADKTDGLLKLYTGSAARQGTRGPGESMMTLGHQRAVRLYWC